MSILVQTIVERMASKLDAEGNDRYTFDQDYKPAINGAIENLVSIMNAAFAQKKLSPENLRELTKVKVWQANSYSRISIKKSDIGHAVWSVVGVYPKPKVNKRPTKLQSSDESESFFRPDISFIDSDYSADRLTLEEWNQNKSNAFLSGNILLSGGLSEYAYLDMADYSSSSYTGLPDKIEITIRPYVPNELVAIAYIKTPDSITQQSGSVEFPESMTEMIVDLSLSHIAYKQGDGTSLFQVTDRNIQRLVALMS